MYYVNTLYIYIYPEGKKSPQILATPQKKSMCSNSSKKGPSPGTVVTRQGFWPRGGFFWGMPPEQLVDVLSIFGRAGWGCGWKKFDIYLVTGKNTEFSPPNGGEQKEANPLFSGESRMEFYSIWPEFVFLKVLSCKDGMFCNIYHLFL